MEAIGDDGSFDASSTRTLSETAAVYSYFRDGDVIRAKVTPCFENGKGAFVTGLTNGLGFGTTELFVLRPGPEIDGRFLYYLTISSPFSRLGEATIYGAHGVKRVDDQFVKNFAFGLPPLSEQRAIAAFLDRETAHIDELIERHQKLADAVGARPSALAAEKCLPSRLPRRWTCQASAAMLVRAMPSGWGASRCKYLFGEVDERSTSGTEMLLLVSKAVGVVPRDEFTDREARADTLKGYKLVRPGDIVINRMRAFNGALGVSRWNGIVSPDYAVLRPTDGVDPRYYACLFRTPPLIDEMRLRLRGIGGTDMGNVRTPRINVEDFGQIVVPVPPLDDQTRIGDELDAAAARHAGAVSRTLAAVRALQERRRAVVTAACGGGVDVPSAGGGA
jgi:type I restriction enzyme S subunit